MMKFCVKFLFSIIIYSLFFRVALSAEPLIYELDDVKYDCSKLFEKSQKNTLQGRESFVLDECKWMKNEQIKIKESCATPAMKNDLEKRVSGVVNEGLGQPLSQFENSPFTRGSTADGYAQLLCHGFFRVLDLPSACISVKLRDDVSVLVKRYRCFDLCYLYGNFPWCEGE